LCQELEDHKQQLAFTRAQSALPGEEVLALRRRVDEQGRRAGELHQERLQMQEAHILKSTLYSDVI